MVGVTGFDGCRFALRSATILFGSDEMGSNPDSAVNKNQGRHKAPLVFVNLTQFLIRINGGCRRLFYDAALITDIVVQHGILHLNMPSNH